MLLMSCLFLLELDYLLKCLASLALRVEALAFNMFITSASLAPLKVFKVLEQTLTLTGVPFTMIVVTCRFGFHTLLVSL